MAKVNGVRYAKKRMSYLALLPTDTLK